MEEELGLIQFQVQRPLGLERVQGNIDHACALGVPELFASRPRLDIIANGPSAMLTPWSDCGTILALNGALDLCTTHDVLPHFWAACDPQELVTDFLTNPPRDVTYLLCSQLHPSVFRRLRHHHTRLWHIRDETTLPPGALFIRHGSSITLTALLLAPLLGFWDIHVWGWDCCVDPLTLTHHASSRGPLNAELRELQHRPSPHGPTLRSFLTTNTWAFEAQQAVSIITELRTLGAQITVHGDGLVRHTLDFHTTLETSTDANARAA